MRKPRGGALVEDNRRGRPLIDRGGDRLLHLDVTDLTAESAASAIARWVLE